VLLVSGVGKQAEVPQLPPPQPPGGGTIATVPGAEGPGTGPGSSVPPGKATAAAGPKAIAVQVVSDPPGATVVLDGETVTGKTPLALALDPSRAHQVTVSLDGYSARRLSVPAGAATSELKVALSPLGPPGSVVIVSGYPVDVSSSGRALSKGETSPTLSLPPGRHTLTITAGSVFLHRTETVEVESGGSARVSLPGTGELNVQANPDNCKIFVDGTFVDYPPILKKTVAAGRHTVTFKWTDGGEQEETIDVDAGKPVYVTGRKD
jgi:hypothetical protein